MKRCAPDAPRGQRTRLSYQANEWSLGIQADYAAAMSRVPTCGNSLTGRQGTASKVPAGSVSP